MSKESVRARINIVRDQLSKMELPKSGQNKFAKFKYYELEDIEPYIVHLCMEQGLFIHFNFPEDRAVLKIEDVNNHADYVICELPFPEVTPINKGMNVMQSLGSYVTYLRRYLYIMMFNINETEIIDKVIGTPETNQQKSSAKKQQKSAADFTHEKVSDEYGSEPVVPEPIKEVIKTIEAKGIEANRETIQNHLDMGALDTNTRKSCINYLKGLKKVKA